MLNIALHLRRGGHDLSEAQLRRPGTDLRDRSLGVETTFLSCRQANAGMSRGIAPINSDEPQYVVVVLANTGQNNLNQRCVDRNLEDNQEQD